ncbi:MAG: hypothetical protein ACJA08_000841 [Cyclobacteriaceae bacterium]|jgi:hypothetical protein
MKLVSAIFHPLLMATYTSLLLYFILPSIYSPILAAFIPYLIGITFITTFFIPALSLIFMRYTHRISNLDITSKDERAVPFLLITCFYGFSTYLFYDKLHVSYAVISIMGTTTFLILLLSILTAYIKISIHAAAIWGLCGIMSAMYLLHLDTSNILLLATLFMAAGITSTSRLYLQRHKSEEVWIGAGIGFLICFSGTYLFV